MQNFQNHSTNKPVNRFTLSFKYARLANDPILIGIVPITFETITKKKVNYIYIPLKQFINKLI